MEDNGDIIRDFMGYYCDIMGICVYRHTHTHTHIIYMGKL